MYSAYSVYKNNNKLSVYGIHFVIKFVFKEARLIKKFLRLNGYETFNRIK